MKTAEDYKPLIGKTVEYWYDKDGNGKVVGILVAIDPEVGITVAKEETPDRNLVCLHGPKGNNYNHHKGFYEPFFEHVVGCIETGEPIVSAKLYALIISADPEYCSTGFIGECAF